jgi:hypothetical protein
MGLAAPAEGAQAATISQLTGRCEGLVIAGRPATPSCRPQLFAILYPTGDISFVFSWADGRMISFRGRAALSTNIQTTLKVTQITAVQGLAARPTRTRVTGSCIYTRFARQANRLDCLVAGRTGQYAGAFVTDGAEPARFVSR